MPTKVDLDDVRRLLRWLRDQPMDLEGMEAELVAWFCWWRAACVHQSVVQSLKWSYSPSATIGVCEGTQQSDCGGCHQLVSALLVASGPSGYELFLC